MDLNKLLLLLGSVPGVIALIGAAIGYGRMKERIDGMEKDMQKVGELSDKVTRIDERTLNTDKHVGEVKADVARLVQNLIDEPARIFRQNRASARD